MCCRKKLLLCLLVTVTVLGVLPWLFLLLAEPQEGMGLVMLFFFVIDPTASVGIGLLIGRDWRRLWWIPLLFSVLFLLFFWLLLEEVIPELAIYAVGYLFLGALACLIRCTVDRFLLPKK